MDQLALAVAGELFEGDDLARAQRVAGHLRRRADQHPGWRLPELAADLQRPEAAREILAAEDEASYEPPPGQLTLTTMHKAKGMEWDLVYLVGVDGIEFPGTPEDYFRGHEPHLGGDPAQMARARLEGLLDPGPRRSEARAGQVEYICERLRLLYVAVTRARRFLSVSFSRTIPSGQRTRTAPESLLFGAPGGPSRREAGRSRMNLPALSQSALSAFARCRRRFYLRFVRRLEWPAPLTGSEQEWERSMRRGERFHLLVQQDALGLPADEIVRASGDAELAAWWERYRRHPPPPPEGPRIALHAELELEVSLAGGQRLVARFDRLEVSGGAGGARLDIVDWKTGAPAPRERLERSWQTSVYRFVALEAAPSLGARAGVRGGHPVRLLAERPPGAAGGAALRRRAARGGPPADRIGGGGNRGGAGEGGRGLPADRRHRRLPPLSVPVLLRPRAGGRAGFGLRVGGGRRGGRLAGAARGPGAGLRKSDGRPPADPAAARSRPEGACG